MNNRNNNNNIISSTYILRRVTPLTEVLFRGRVAFLYIENM